MVAHATESVSVGRIGVAQAASAVRALLEASQLRLAFGGQLGAGKTTMCEAIATVPFPGKERLPIFNHADGLKEEVLEWVSDARRRAYMPGEEATFEHFCNFLGISPGIVRLDMQELLMPLWASFDKLLSDVYEHQIPVVPYAKIPPKQQVERKVAFVDSHKPFFRTALQLWGQTVKDLNADPYHWVNETVGRSIGHAPCLNGDTRFPEEMELMHATGWLSVYITVSEENQRLRRPETTDEQRRHKSETALGPEDCTYVVDGDRPISDVLLQIVDRFEHDAARKKAH